jgi:hypothetical protein
MIYKFHVINIDIISMKLVKLKRFDLKQNLEVHLFKNKGVRNPTMR